MCGARGEAGQGRGQTRRHRRHRPLQPTGKDIYRVPTAQGKQGKFCQNTGKTQGIWFAQVVNSLTLKVKDILIFGAKISI